MLPELRAHVLTFMSSVACFQFLGARCKSKSVEVNFYKSNFFVLVVFCRIIFFMTFGVHVHVM